MFKVTSYIIFLLVVLTLNYVLKHILGLILMDISNHFSRVLIVCVTIQNI